MRQSSIQRCEKASVPTTYPHGAGTQLSSRRFFPPDYMLSKMHLVLPLHTVIRGNVLRF